MKKSRPILFSTPMVQALLEGRKTQTRRVISVQPSQPDMKIFECVASTNRKHVDKCHYAKMAENGYNYEKQDNVYFSCPYGKVGDLLWVRETTRVGMDVVKGFLVHVLEYRAGMQPGWPLSVGADISKYKDGAWKPSIFMPKWASRITLEITNIRVERLHDISRGDCMAEGCPFPNIAKETDPVKWYRDLWQSLNGKDSWDKNPWVWVVEFKVKKEGK